MKTKLLLVALLTMLFARFADAQNAKLWGLGYWGGTNSQGTILQADSTGTNFHVVYDCVNVLGQAPEGGMVLANNGSLYGVTELGGWGDSCVIFRYDTATNMFYDIHDLFQFMAKGWEAKSAMINAADGMLYGLCGQGGLYGHGTIYRIDPAIDSFTDVHDFKDTLGAGPFGSLLQLADGKLYGMTNSGGLNSSGVIFSFNPSNGQYSVLYNFDILTGLPSMFGSLIMASDNKLYGTSGSGGTKYLGAIFSYDLSTGIFVNEFEFDSIYGIQPYGRLVQADNGKLYGMTSAGGADSVGVIFNYNISTHTYSKLFDFDHINGGTPYRSLTQTSSGKLFGCTQSGGLNNQGVFFNFDITTNTFHKLLDCNATTGTNPSCDILETGARPKAAEPNGFGSVNSFTNEIQLSPNPAVSSVVISHLQLGNTIHIYDVMGREVISKEQITKNNEMQINTSILEDGVYFVTVNNGNQMKRGKLVISK